MRFIGKIQLSQVCRATTRIVCFLPLLPHNMNPTFCCFFGGGGGGGGGVEAHTTSSKRGEGELTGSQFLERGCWERRLTFFREVVTFT